MFIVSLAAFKPGNHLYPVLRICAASLIMYHNQLTKDLPLNPISDKLLKVARESKIQNIGSVDSPEVVLNGWSTIIYQDFRSRNPELTPPTADLRDLCATIGQVVAQMNTQSGVLHELVQESHRRESAYQVMKDQASQLHNDLAARDVELSRLQGVLAKKNNRIAVFKRALETPPDHDRSISRRLDLEAETDSTAPSLQEMPAPQPLCLQTTTSAAAAAP